MSKATADQDAVVPRYEWTKDELQAMTMAELIENFQRVSARILEIAPQVAY